MHSEFVILLRKIRWKRAEFPEAEELLFREYCEIQRLIRRTALKEPRLLKQFAHNTLKEIDVEEIRIKECAERENSNIKSAMSRKDSNNRLSEEHLKELKKHEEEFNYFNEILTCIEDAKATLYEYLAAYYPDEVVANDDILSELRKFLPRYNLYRDKIEKAALDAQFRHGSTSDIPFEKLAMEEKAKHIIGALNFEKANSIICDGISARMPKTLERLQKVKEMRPEDKKRFEAYDGLSKEQIIAKLKASVTMRRDQILADYEKIFKQIEESAVDPEFTKQLTKKPVFENVIDNKQHYLTLRQYPSDWNNIPLFAQLWAYHLLIKSWSGLPKRKKSESRLLGTVTLKGLFENHATMAACIDILHQVSPALLDSSNVYIGKSKGAFCIWIMEMQKLSLIKRATRKIYTDALNGFFKGLDLEGSTFSKQSKKAEYHYQALFSKNLLTIKRSESSRK